MPETPQGVQVAALADPVGDRLFRSRTLLLTGEIDHDVAARIVARLLALDAEGDGLITMFVHSPGGHLESGDVIHDVVRFIRARVRMIGSGWVASAGALAYVAAPREDRLCLPNTRFLLHQPSGGTKGHATDMEIEAREIIRTRERVNRIFAEATGQTVERIEADTRRNYWMDAAAAVAYGLVGRIVEKAEEVA